ncbi:hypothetical protein D9M72_309340 [compost metagenome]
MVDEDAVTAVQRSLRYGVEQAEGRHHGTSGQHFYLQIATGHIIDLPGEVEREFVKDVLGWPGALPAHADRPLRLDNARRGDRCDPRYCRTAQEFATRNPSLDMGSSLHMLLPKAQAFLAILDNTLMQSPTQRLHAASLKSLQVRRHPDLLFFRGPRADAGVEGRRFRQRVAAVAER